MPHLHSWRSKIRLRLSLVPHHKRELGICWVGYRRPCISETDNQTFDLQPHYNGVEPNIYEKYKSCISFSSFLYIFGKFDKRFWIIQKHFNKIIWYQECPNLTCLVEIQISYAFSRWRIVNLTTTSMIENWGRSLKTESLLRLGLLLYMCIRPLAPKSFINDS